MCRHCVVVQCGVCTCMQVWCAFVQHVMGTHVGLILLTCRDPLKNKTMNRKPTIAQLATAASAVCDKSGHTAATAIIVTNNNTNSNGNNNNNSNNTSDHTLSSIMKNKKIISKSNNNSEQAQSKQQHEPDCSQSLQQHEHSPPPQTKPLSSKQSPKQQATASVAITPTKIVEETPQGITSTGLVPYSFELADELYVFWYENRQQSWEFEVWFYSWLFLLC